MTFLVVPNNDVPPQIFESLGLVQVFVDTLDQGVEFKMYRIMNGKCWPLKFNFASVSEVDE